MSAGPSKWNLLRPKWVLLLLVLVAACLAMLWLGRWQWRAGRHSGDITNYSYACQWWAFTVFAVIMYLRIIRDYLRSDVAKAQAHPEPAPAAPSRYVGYTAPPSAPRQDDEDDPERARFNTYLASLYAADGLGMPSELDAAPTKGTPA